MDPFEPPASFAEYVLMATGDAEPKLRAAVRRILEDRNSGLISLCGYPEPFMDALEATVDRSLCLRSLIYLPGARLLLLDGPAPADWPEWIGPRTTVISNDPHGEIAVLDVDYTPGENIRSEVFAWAFGVQMPSD